MVREFIVNQDRYYQDLKGKMHKPGERIICDDAIPHNKSQLFKLIPVESYDYDLAPTVKADDVGDYKPEKDKALAEPEEVSAEPAKAAKPKKKAGATVDPDKAKSMLERVEEFVKEQKDKK